MKVVGLIEMILRKKNFQIYSLGDCDSYEVCLGRKFFERNCLWVFVKVVLVMFFVAENKAYNEIEKFIEH